MRNRCIYYTSTGNDIDGITFDYPAICQDIFCTSSGHQNAWRSLRSANVRQISVVGTIDSINIISGAFVCLFYMSIILQLAVEIKYKMSYNILIWA